MEFSTAAEIANKWCISQRRVQILCAEGRIPGVFKLGDFWAIPTNSEKPRDDRKGKKDTKKEVTKNAQCD